MKKRRKAKKYPKLGQQARKLAKKAIREEIKTGKYPRRQAVAIGLSRARAEARHESAMATARKYL